MANCGGGPGPHTPKDVGGVSHPAIIEVGSFPLQRGAWFVTIAEGGVFMSPNMVSTLFPSSLWP